MPTAPGQPHGAVFIGEIRNTGKASDQIIGARSNVARSMEVHRMTMDNNVMKMREIPAIEIPANGRIGMAHGNKEGIHLMLMNLNKPLKEGDRFPMTIIFKQAGEQEVTVQVEKRSHPMDHGNGKH